jgi:hypothetical protein
MISVTSDAVEITKLITSAIGALAWPVVVLIIALVFRSYIAGIIGRATGIEWGSFKVAFERKLETAEQIATQIPAPEGEADFVEPPLPAENLPPDYVIIDAWRRIELELVQLAERTGHSLMRGRSPLYLIRVLRSRGVLDPTTAALLDDLRALRNAAVHPGAGPPITREQALRFRDLADLAVPRLRALPGGED